MTFKPRDTCTDTTGWAGIRTILVPPGIVAVPRQSPPRVKKRTPWRPQPDGEALTERAGAREWFSDHLFVEAQQGHVRSGYGTSITLHVSCAIVLIVVLLTRPDRALLVRAGPSLVMPATIAMAPVSDAPSQVPRSLEQPAPDSTPRPPAAAPLPAAVNTPAPVEAQSGIKPETGAEIGGLEGGVESGVESRIESGIESGVEGGIAGGIVGGLLDGAPSSGPSSSGPVRLGGGNGIMPPRRIKDVKPAYPQSAVSARAQGTVIIEATIGIDGKVQDARVLHSEPPFDQAAIDAVRQWEYTPSLLKGVPVAIIMTVIVRFGIQ